MLQKHIKAVSLVLVLCLIAVMYVIFALLGDGVGSGAAAEVMLLIFVTAAGVPVYLAHEKHD